MTVRKITAQELLKEFHVLEKMAQSERIAESFCLDDYIQEEVMEAIQELNTLYSEYSFEHQDVYGGASHDLIVTNIERKEAYDRIPKTRTYGELFYTLETEFQIKTSAKFHHNPNEGMTEKEYQEKLSLYRAICFK